MYSVNRYLLHGMQIAHLTRECAIPHCQPLQRGHSHIAARRMHPSKLIDLKCYSEITYLPVIRTKLDAKVSIEWCRCILFIHEERTWAWNICSKSSINRVANEVSSEVQLSDVYHHGSRVASATYVKWSVSNLYKHLSSFARNDGFKGLSDVLVSKWPRGPTKSHALRILHK